MWDLLKKFLLWSEGIEDKNDKVNSWSAAYVRSLKRLILRIEGFEDKNDCVNNWSAIISGAFRNLNFGLKVLRIKITQLKIDQLLMWELLKDLYYGL